MSVTGGVSVLWRSLRVRCARAAVAAATPARGVACSRWSRRVARGRSRALGVPRSALAQKSDVQKRTASGPSFPTESRCERCGAAVTRGRAPDVPYRPRRFRRLSVSALTGATSPKLTRRSTLCAARLGLSARGRVGGGWLWHAGRQPHVSAAARSRTPAVPARRYLVPADLTVGQFVFVIRKRIKVPPEKAIFVFIGSYLPPTGAPRWAPAWAAR